MTDKEVMKPCAGRSCGSTDPNLHSAECFEDYERTTGMSNCPDCERYKESAKNWRHKAYELSGHPLPWERGDTWVGLTDVEIAKVVSLAGFDPDWVEARIATQIVRVLEAKLKEKNT